MCANGRLILRKAERSGSCGSHEVEGFLEGRKQNEPRQVVGMEVSLEKDSRYIAQYPRGVEFQRMVSVCVFLPLCLLFPEKKNVGSSVTLRLEFKGCLTLTRDSRI